MKISLIKIERIFARLNKMWVDWRGTSDQIYFQHRVSEYREIWRAVAQKIGAKFTILAEDLWELELNEKKTRILNHELEFDNPVTLGIAGRKPFVHSLLKQHAIPVPQHIVFRLEELAVAFNFLKHHQ